MRKPVFGDLTRSHTNRAAQPQRMARDLKFSDVGSRGIVLFSVNKGADLLRGYCAADLHLCFCLCKKQVFS